MAPPYLRSFPDGVEILLAVRPRAGRSRVVGQMGDRLKVQVAAPPVDGAANEALCEFLAKRLGVAKTCVTIVAGHRGARKTVRVANLAPEAAVRMLQEGSP